MPLSNTHHNLLDQRRLTRDEGEYVTHYTALPCSCREQPGGQPKPMCRVCGGSGRAYHAGVRIKGLIVTVQAQDKVLMQLGMAMPGDLTFSPDIEPVARFHDEDILRLDYGLPYEGDVVVRGEDRLAYVPARILSVERHDPYTAQRIVYSFGVDYTIDGQRIAWNPDCGPERQQSYSVRYDAIYDWVVYPGVTVPRIKRGTFLGQRVLLKKRHMTDLAASGVVLPPPTPGGLVLEQGGYLLLE